MVEQHMEAQAHANSELQDQQLKGNIYFNKVAEGVYFQGVHGGFVLKGQQIYPIVAKIVSFIDAGVSLQDIHHKLPEKVRPLFQRLLAQWQQHQMLMPRQVKTMVPESWWACPEFVDFYRYLHEACVDFEQRFPRWQQQRVLLLGDGPSLVAALHGLAISGLSTLHIAVVNDTATATTVNAVVADYRQQLPGWQCHFDIVDKLPIIAGDDYDQVLYCSTRLPYSNQQWHGPEQVTVVVGGVAGRALVSPIASISQSDHLAMLQQLRSASDSQLRIPDAAWSVLGSVAALNLVKAFFALELNTLRNYVYQVSPYLELSRHPLLPALTLGDAMRADTDPDSTQSLTFESEFELPEERDMLLYERVRLALFPYFDSLLGCFDESAGRQLKQVPFFHARLDVRAHTSDNTTAVVMAVGLSADSAALRALSQAINVRLSAAIEADTGPLTVAFEWSTWQQQAFATWWINQPEHRQQMLSMRVPITQIGDEEVQLLWRFLCSHEPSLQTLHIYWEEQARCFVCGLDLNGSVLAAVSYSPLEAVRLCLAERYLQQQFVDIKRAGADIPNWVNQLPSLTLDFDESGEGWRRLLHKPAASLPSLSESYYDASLKKHGVYAGVVEPLGESLEVV